eukprot:scaffold76022_cov49-Attheya_sp.AAC.1
MEEVNECEDDLSSSKKRNNSEKRAGYDTVGLGYSSSAKAKGRQTKKAKTPEWYDDGGRIDEGGRRSSSRVAQQKSLADSNKADI